MAKHKYIYKREDMGMQGEKMFVNVHYLVGYCPQTITEYKEMLAEMKKDFPEATEDEVNCHQIRQSNTYDGFTLLTFNAYLNPSRIEAAIKNGWMSLEKMNYWW